jgi:hypothetical protein
MALARSRRERGIDYWPGFVDALSTLVLGIIFLLTVFVVVQFFLSQEVAGKDTALVRLNAQIAQLTDLLSLEKTGKVDLEDEIARMRASLAGVEAERDRLRAGADAGLGIASAQSQLAEAQGKITTLSGSLDTEKSVSARALAQVEILNQQIAALRRQLATPRRRRTRSPSPGSPISASGSTWRWPSGSRSCRATARISSAGCARFSATVPTSGWSATASCSSPRCSSTPARRS